jgi:DNA mismatch repair protein MutL
VVERPASVLKELIENAIDAEATEIEVSLENAGFDLIQVKDNGQGMSAADMKKSVERYATSKISKKEDLFNISSFGFRGEALSSISSVSLFRLETKRDEDVSASFIEIHGGYMQAEGETAANTGTKVSVRDLFFNVPARKKFLKTENTEYKHCLELVENLAYANPSVVFILKHNNKEVLNLSSHLFEERLKALMGRETFEKLIRVNQTGDFLAVSGFVSKPGEVFKTRTRQKVFVNNRPVTDKTVMSAIAEAYRSYLEKGAYPAYYLFLEIAPDLVDVNVHPRKTEVRFMRGNEIFLGVKKAISSAFSEALLSFKSEGTYVSEEPRTVFKPAVSNASYSAKAPSFKNEAPQAFSFSPSLPTFSTKKRSSFNSKFGRRFKRVCT